MRSNTRLNTESTATDAPIHGTSEPRVPFGHAMARPSAAHQAMMTCTACRRIARSPRTATNGRPRSIGRAPCCSRT
eukprot:7224911-Heterocapsa_arctica.AAC.1